MKLSHFTGSTLARQSQVCKGRKRRLLMDEERWGDGGGVGGRRAVGVVSDVSDLHAYVFLLMYDWYR